MSAVNPNTQINRYQPIIDQIESKKGFAFIGCEADRARDGFLCKLDPTLRIFFDDLFTQLDKVYTLAKYSGTGEISSASQVKSGTNDEESRIYEAQFAIQRLSKSLFLVRSLARKSEQSLPQGLVQDLDWFTTVIKDNANTILSNRDDDVSQEIFDLARLFAKKIDGIDCDADELIKLMSEFTIVESVFSAIVEQGGAAESHDSEFQQSYDDDVHESFIDFGHIDEVCGSNHLYQRYGNFLESCDSATIKKALLQVFCEYITNALPNITKGDLSDFDFIDGIISQKDLLGLFKKLDDKLSVLRFLGES